MMESGGGGCPKGAEDPAKSFVLRSAEDID
jgi:hypothetical protein